MIADATQISEDGMSRSDYAREQDAIVQAAWELYQHLIRRGCSDESAAGAADLLVEEEYRKRRPPAAALLASGTEGMTAEQ